MANVEYYIKAESEHGQIYYGNDEGFTACFDHAWTFSTAFRAEKHRAKLLKLNTSFKRITVQSRNSFNYQPPRQAVQPSLFEA